MSFHESSRLSGGFSAGGISIVGCPIEIPRGRSAHRRSEPIVVLRIEAAKGGIRRHVAVSASCCLNLRWGIHDGVVIRGAQSPRFVRRGAWPKWRPTHESQYPEFGSIRILCPCVLNLCRAGPGAPAGRSL